MYIIVLAVLADFYVGADISCNVDLVNEELPRYIPPREKNVNINRNEFNSNTSWSRVVTGYRDQFASA